MLLFFKPEFIKEAYSKDLYPWYLKVFYPNKYRFYFLLDFAWTTPTKYDDHPYHPNIGSTSPSPPSPRRDITSSLINLGKLYRIKTMWAKIFKT